MSDSKVERIYLDTSVFGGYFDAEFAVWTKMLFDQIVAGKYKVIYSQINDIELESAPPKVKNLIAIIPQGNLEVVENSAEAISLAGFYLSENVVGITSRTDCNHIALATIHHADILISWNFKHIVNVARIRGYNAVNVLLGHKILEIRTPRELLEYEN